MVKKNLFFLCLVALFLMPGRSSLSADEGLKELVIPGSGACEAILSGLAAEFNHKHSGVSVLVPKSTGSSGGIRVVAEGTFQLGRIARPLNKNEEGLGLTVLPFAYDAVVFAVGKNVTVRSLGVDRLADIFSGKIKNWQDIGGPRAPIRVLSRQADETSLLTIRKALPAFRDLVFTDDVKTAYHDYEMMDLINKFGGGIGFLTRGSLAIPGNRIHSLALDGVVPTTDTLHSGKYPLKVTLGFVYKKGNLDKVSGQFVEFVFSEKGKKIIETYGLFPIEKRE